MLRRWAATIVLLAACSAPAEKPATNDASIDATQRALFALFRGAPTNGLVDDVIAPVATGDVRRAVCRVGSIGPYLAGLCVAESRGWVSRDEAVLRIRRALHALYKDVEQEHGFFYRLVDSSTGRRAEGTECSPLETSLVLCGALTVRQHFDDVEIRDLATKLYERVDWPWMLNGGRTFCLGWKPGYGFSRHRWEGYAGHLAMYLLAMGSPTHPVPASTWNAWKREPVVTEAGMTFIKAAGSDARPYAHAFVNFNGLADGYADYGRNEQLATSAQKIIPPRTNVTHSMDAAMTIVESENGRSGLVWNRFMANAEIGGAMKLAGFKPAPAMDPNSSLVDIRRSEPPAHRAAAQQAVARRQPKAETELDWHTMDAENARDSIYDGENTVFMRFAFAWDETNLYFCANVTDPDVVSERPPERIHLQDVVELFVDPGCDGLIWGSTNDFQFGFAVTNKCYEWFGRRIPTDVKVEPAREGYTVRAAIPWTLLGIKPAAGLEIGMTPEIDSVSRVDEPAVKLNWRWRVQDGRAYLGTLKLE